MAVEQPRRGSIEQADGTPGCRRHALHLAQARSGRAEIAAIVQCIRRRWPSGGSRSGRCDGRSSRRRRAARTRSASKTRTASRARRRAGSRRARRRDGGRCFVRPMPPAQPRQRRRSTAAAWPCATAAAARPASACARGRGCGVGAQARRRRSVACGGTAHRCVCPSSATWRLSRPSRPVREPS